jgi:hypothetical protein
MTRYFYCTECTECTVLSTLTLRSAPLATAVRRPEHHFPVRQTGQRQYGCFTDSPIQPPHRRYKPQCTVLTAKAPSAQTHPHLQGNDRERCQCHASWMPPTEGRARTRKSIGEWEACQWRHLIAICNKFDSRRTRRECGWPFNAGEFRFRFRLRFRFRGRVSQSASSKFESPLHFIPPARYYYQLARGPRYLTYLPSRCTYLTYSFLST